ncbi:ATP cone domain-containing protein [Candidatus Nitrosocosmicus franklandus]|uniref:Transcriptional regulator NrdR n=1 Tax=Candidatus Nitrosocosmicus franklandianus TaxID=1798806 RepID=A0A484IEB1_9ARCH|nr:ATP cone domain-containing protein [Candidatus Nitrosocosmicus franklandus]VFJ14467.1 Transcriptional regulator NrdR [Candidatus Nitrosocosmicus franklandus]
MTADANTEQKRSTFYPLSELTVLKRSGNSEKFNQEKLARGITRAGTPYMLANDISKSITSKLASNPHIDNVILSSKLREYVSTELRQRNQNTIAESYLGYSKNSVTSISEEQLKNNKYNSKVSQTTNTRQKQFAKDKDNTSGRNTKRGI